MTQPDTKLRVLDAAERLFAADGFDCTSLRQITAAANANLAAVHYHFGSKEALVEAVFARRMEPLNRLRRERIEEVLAAARERGEPPRAAALLEAFLEPAAALLEAGPETRHFAVLVGRALVEPGTTLRAPFLRLVAPTFLHLFEAMCQALPHLGREEVFGRLHFGLGSIAHTLRWSARLEEEGGEMPLPPGVAGRPSGATLMARLVRFLAAGMEAP